MIEIKVGDYVLATKYSDGDPADNWAVGYVNEIKNRGNDRGYFVGNNETHSFRVGGYWGGCIRISGEVGGWLLQHSKLFESSPPGAVNLIKMVDGGFYEEDENTTGEGSGAD